MFHVFMVEAPGTAPGSSLLSNIFYSIYNYYYTTVIHKSKQLISELAAGAGLEPASVSAHEKQSCVFTDFTTQQLV